MAAIQWQMFKICPSQFEALRPWGTNLVLPLNSEKMFSLQVLTYSSES